jgi:hypothetical protein
MPITLTPSDISVQQQLDHMCITNSRLHYILNKDLDTAKIKIMNILL